MSEPRIGLALGGGSARGLAHIPMLEVFDELGIRPARMAGCSIGAVIGAAYAGGMTAREIRARAEQILNTRFDAMRYVFGSQRTKIRDILALKGFASLHLNAEKLIDLVLPHTIPARIEEMPIPFCVVATDFDARQERVFYEGSLIKAVAASIAIPGVILGPTFDGRVYVDGGCTNPVPFDHVREGTDIVVAIDVTGKPQPPARRHHTNRELALGSLLIMFHQVAMLRHEANPPDIYIEPATESFRAGDFFRLQEVFEAAQPAKEELKRKLDRLFSAGA